MTLALVTVTGTLRQPDNLTALQGTVTFMPNGGVLVDAADGRILAGAVTVQLDAFGSFSVALPATDNAGVQPAANTWNWHCTANLSAAAITPFNFALLGGSGPVDLSAVVQVAPISGDYVITPGPPGHTPRVYHSAGVPTVLHTDGDLTITDAGDVYQQVAGAWVATGANIRGPAGTGGGSAAPTARVRITDDNLSGLPSAPSWTVAVTSAGTRLVCKIKAVVGDRIELDPNWMREGSHFTDHVILKADGTIWGYASSDGGPTPGAEGNPDMYPALNESYVTSTDEFTVAAENIDTDGYVTIGVAHQGTGAGKVFAHPIYPWRLRLKNIGPEPAGP